MQLYEEMTHNVFFIINSNLPMSTDLAVLPNSVPGIVSFANNAMSAYKYLPLQHQIFHYPGFFSYS